MISGSASEKVQVQAPEVECRLGLEKQARMEKPEVDHSPEWAKERPLKQSRLDVSKSVRGSSPELDKPISQIVFLSQAALSS